MTDRGEIHPGDIKIVSGGSPTDTRVDVLGNDGTWVPLRGVQKISWEVSYEMAAVASIQTVLTEAELIVDRERVDRYPPGEDLGFGPEDGRTLSKAPD